MTFDSSIWEAFTNCSKAATSALPDKPRPNSEFENDVPSFSYHTFLLVSRSRQICEMSTDIGANNHGYMSKVPRSYFGGSANGGEAVRSNRRLPQLVIEGRRDESITYVHQCLWVIQGIRRVKRREINLRRNSFQASDGSGICGASRGLQKGFKWFARFIVSRGWWRTFAGIFFSSAF